MHSQNHPIQKQNIFGNKRPLREVLSNYLQKKHYEKESIEKIKRELVKVKSNIKDVKTSFESLIEIQEKLRKIYGDIKNEEQEKACKNN